MQKAMPVEHKAYNRRNANISRTITSLMTAAAPTVREYELVEGFELPLRPYQYMSVVSS